VKYIELTPGQALEQLKAQRQKLMLALGNTSRTIEFEDRRIERFNPDELMTAIAAVDQQIAALSGQPDKSRMFTVSSSSGLGTDACCCGGGDVRDDRYEAWR